MRVEQCRWTASGGWGAQAPGGLGATAQLALVFGGTAVVQDQALVRTVTAAYPQAQIVGCSTAGEIFGTQVADDSLTVTAVAFEHARVRAASAAISEGRESRQVGERLGAALEPQGLVHVIVFSDGQRVNGSELVRGIAGRLPAGVAVTGGLAGDGTRFQHTLVWADGAPAEGRVVVLGLYGAHLRVGYGSLGGWDPFGPERLITRSEGNVLYELDEQPALALYKQYLGEHAAGLPAAGLLFPLSVRSARGGGDVVRTILSVDEAGQSLTFAGDVPTGDFARLMKANFDRLVDGAHGAAQRSHAALDAGAAELALLISCVGRKLVLQQRTEEELEAVREVLGPQAALTGFYSYGEICPAAPNTDCQLHNQTMTITTLAEA